MTGLGSDSLILQSMEAYSRVTTSWNSEQYVQNKVLGAHLTGRVSTNNVNIMNCETISLLAYKVLGAHSTGRV